MSTAGILSTFSLQGRTALVTGGYRGLSLAFARGLAQAGADVVIGELLEACAAAAAALADETDRTVVGVGLDVTDQSSGQAAVATAIERTGRLDVLVNNASSCIHRPALEIPN